MICQNTSIPTTRHTINGTGIMKVNQGCSIHSDTFSLPASSTFINEAPLIIMPYPFSTPIAFSSWEHSVIVNSTNISLSDSFGLEPWSVPQYIDNIQLLQKQSIPREFSYQEWKDWLFNLAASRGHCRRPDSTLHVPSLCCPKLSKVCACTDHSWPPH